MDSLRPITILVLSLLLALQGCGGSSVEETKQVAKPPQREVSEAEANLQKAREELTALKQNNEHLAQRCEVLTAKTKELEEIAREKVAKKAPASQPSSIGDDARIELMGAKAIAEFRAKQLSARLDTLSKDLERKDQELEAIRSTAKQKEEEVEALRKSMEQLRATAETQTQNLSRRMEELGRQVQERSEETKKLQKEVNDKTSLLESLKSAVADAGKLKSQAESQSAQLRTQLNEALKQLQAAQAESQQRSAEAAQLRSQIGTFKQETEQWRSAAERFREEAERYGQAVQELQAQASELTAKLQTQESAEQPAAVDEDYVPRIVEEITAGFMAKAQ
jgi:DNA repair exonuclease SbcCD ATPase subunit